MANSFAQKRHSWPEHRIFIFDWRDDPRKSETWYAKQQDELDPVTLAQEVDRDYLASVEGVVIPGAWVRAAIDANAKLGIAPTGRRRGAMDVADEGKDNNALAIAYGTELEEVIEWSGKGSDIFASVEKVFMLCDERNLDGFDYDADGVGADVRGAARVINERRDIQSKLDVGAFRGSEAVAHPESEDMKGRKNKDFFANRKAQAWWSLRTRFQTTFRAIEDLKLPAHDRRPFNPDEIISISPKPRNYLKLCAELSQPTYSLNGAGKIVVDKTPEGARSPNLADAVMIRFAAPKRRPIIISDAVLRMSQRG